MAHKANINSIRQLIKEVKQERAYHEKFILNFEDVRTSVLDEATLVELADALYEEIFKK